MLNHSESNKQMDVQAQESTSSKHKFAQFGHCPTPAASENAKHISTNSGFVTPCSKEILPSTCIYLAES